MGKKKSKIWGKLHFFSSVIKEGIDFLKNNWRKVLTIGSIALVIGLIVDFSELQKIYLSYIEPKIDISYFFYDENDFPIINNSDEIIIDITNEDFQSGKIKIPINLAIKNLENRRLSLVRIEIQYDKNINLLSNGKQKIDPDQKLVIYEHEFGTLEIGDKYTMMETIDILEIPFSFIFTPVVGLSKDGVPLYSLIIVGFKENYFINDSISFEFTIFTEGRKPVSRTLVFKMQLMVDVLFPTDGSTGTICDVTEEDIGLFNIRY